MFGLVLVCIGFILLLIYAVSNIYNNKKQRIKFKDENKLTFDFIFIVLLIGSIIGYFMIDKSGEIRTLYCIIGLMISYNSILLRDYTDRKEKLSCV